MISVYSLLLQSSILFIDLTFFLCRKTTFRETLKALPSAIKPFTILVIYFLMYQFSGVNTITFYAVEVFKVAGTTWDPNFCAIFMGVVRLIFTIVGCIAMRRCGRRPLTFISSIGCGVSMVCLGIYLQYKYHLDRMVPPVQAQYTWFPVTCIFVFTICCTVGYLIVPWVSIDEIFHLIDSDIPLLYCFISFNFHLHFFLMLLIIVD